MNILGTAAARKQLSEGQARQAFAEMLQDAPIWQPTVPLLDEALNLALAHQRALYDCLYVALAIREKCQLITADEALVRQLQPIYGCLVALSSLP
jgi:predicted nucleic acid-binding protein